MQRFLLPAILLIAVLMSSRCKSNQTNSYLPRKGFTAILVDPSGTTRNKDWPMPGKSFFNRVIDSLAVNGGGALYVYNLGYVLPNPCTLYIEPIVPNHNPWDTEYENTRKNNLETQKRNTNNTAGFYATLDTFLLRYHPASEDDYTYILPAIQSLTNTLHGIGMKYDYRNVLLYTDMVHHEKGGQPRRLPAVQWNVLTEVPNTDVYLCSYADTSGYHVLNFTMCGSYEEFPQLAFSVRNTHK